MDTRGTSVSQKCGHPILTSAKIHGIIDLNDQYVKHEYMSVFAEFLLWANNLNESWELMQLTISGIK